MNSGRPPGPATGSAAPPRDCRRAGAVIKLLPRQGESKANGRAAREKIILAAIGCIEKDGLRRVTIRGIARAAGANSAAISYYFA